MTPDLKVVPGIASYRQVDDLTYSFDIKPGVTFQDGTPYDAAAAKFNLDRMLDPKNRFAAPRRSRPGILGRCDGTIELHRQIYPALRAVPAGHDQSRRSVRLADGIAEAWG